MELNKIYNEDCVEGMKRIDDKSIDMILCDLPYGTTKCKWDIIIPFVPLWEQYNRIIKENGAIVLFSTQPFTSKLILSNIEMYKQEVIWSKTRPTNVFNAKKQFMKWHENIEIFYKKLPTYNPQMRADGRFTGAKVQRMTTKREDGVFIKTGEKKDYVHESNNGLFYPKDVIEISNVNKHKNIHPTQKPIELLEWFIKTYTNENELVLDNCMGSGSTAIASINTNRNYIGFELDKSYFNLANKRIEEHNNK